MLNLVLDHSPAFVIGELLLALSLGMFAIAFANTVRERYRRGGLIVSTGFDKMQTWDGRTIEVQIIEERNNYALLEDIEAVAGFDEIRRAHQEVDADAADPAAGAHAQAAADRLRLPNLVSVVNCPTIKANGELIGRTGLLPR